MFLEKKLAKEYPKDKGAPYAIMNSLGFMHGSKITAKGKAAEKKHIADVKKKLKEKKSAVRTWASGEGG